MVFIQVKQHYFGYIFRSWKLSKAEVFNHRKNDAARFTYDDIFHKRFFSSRIVKESNKYDRKISEYKEGIDALLEAEKIKEEIFNLEHDLWEYNYL